MYVQAKMMFIQLEYERKVKIYTFIIQIFVFFSIHIKFFIVQVCCFYCC